MISAFDELILSFRACRDRPLSLSFRLLIKNRWTPYLPYLEWGPSYARSFRYTFSEVSVDQDTISLSNALAQDLQVRSCRPCQLYPYHGHQASFYPTPLPAPLPSILHPVRPLSQFALQHPLSKRICSPTALASLTGDDPLHLAKQVHDQTFDIYGNWVFNTAATEKFRVTRLASFEELYTHLPAVVSVQGPLEGAPLPYLSGHLLVVRGWEAGRVLVMDPAFPTHEETLTSYPIESFLAAWDRRRRLAYISS